MAKSVPKSSINVFGNIFTNGERVPGELILTATSPVKVDSITIKCICDRQIRCGGDYCPPGEKRADFEVSMWGTNKRPFSIKHFTTCFDQLEFSFNQELPPGTHGFKFRLRLPANGGPETFGLQGFYSKVVWYAHASIRLSTGVQEVKTEFTFVPQHNLSAYRSNERKEVTASTVFKIRNESRRVFNRYTDVKVAATLSSFKKGLSRAPEPAGLALSMRCSQEQSIQLVSITLMFGESLITGIRDANGSLQCTGRNPHLKQPLKTLTFNRELAAQEDFDEFRKIAIPEIVTGAFEDDLFNYRHFVDAEIVLVNLVGPKEPQTLTLHLWSGVIPRPAPTAFIGPPVEEEDPPPPYSQGETPPSRFGRFINRTFGAMAQPWAVAGGGAMTNM